MGSSPHTRGAPREDASQAAHLGIIPAYAGSTTRYHADPRPASDHPRIRGEHRGAAIPSRSSAGSSPHTRGAQPLYELDAHGGRIIPAYAGSTYITPPPFSTSPDHPRIRGEHIDRGVLDDRAQGSSPHTRGAPYRWGMTARSHGIIPAYAGSTLGNPCNTKDRRRDYTSFPLPVTHPSGGGGS